MDLRAADDDDDDEEEETERDDDNDVVVGDDDKDGVDTCGLETVPPGYELTDRVSVAAVVAVAVVFGCENNTGFLDVDNMAGG